jgi:hypothetical protein
MAFHTTFQHPAFSPECITIGRARDDHYKRFNFDLCRALDMTKLGIVLDQMVETGAIDKRMAELFHLQAGSLLALMLSENNRTFNEQRAKDTPDAKA